MDVSLLQLHDDAQAKLEAGDARGAFMTLRPLLEDRAALADEAAFRRAFELFAKIAAKMVDETFAAKVRAAAAQRDLKALYDVGYQLIEQGIPNVAATVLARANAIAPGDEEIVTELCAALERAGRNDEAYLHLRTAPPELLEESPICRYLLGFNALACGNLEEPRTAIESLEQVHDETIAFVRETLRGMVQRADAVKPVRGLGDHDLRGWHFVMTGGILLHHSPHGFDEPMRGRYAFVQDSPALCKEGLVRLRAVLEALAIDLPVAGTPDRGGTILGHAAAEVLGRPLVAFGKPAIVIAYDMDQCDEKTARALVEHHGERLFVHAASWTDPFPYAADVVTFLHQSNIAPWGEQLRAGTEGGGVEKSPADARAPEGIAADVVAATPESLDDLDDLRAIARIAKTLAEPATPGILRTSGRRRRNYGDSPVKSNRSV
ncbi:MAG: hypothetical protein ACXWP4_10825 [Polyangiales bacterium]